MSGLNKKDLEKHLTHSGRPGDPKAPGDRKRVSGGSDPDMQEPGGTEALPTQKPHGSRGGVGHGSKKSLMIVLRRAAQLFPNKNIPKWADLENMDDQGVWDVASKIFGGDDNTREILDALPSKGQGQHLNVNEIPTDLVRRHATGAKKPNFEELDVPRVASPRKSRAAIRQERARLIEEQKRNQQAPTPERRPNLGLKVRQGRQEANELPPKLPEDSAAPEILPPKPTLGMRLRSASRKKPWNREQSEGVQPPRKSRAAIRQERARLLEELNRQKEPTEELQPRLERETEAQEQAMPNFEELGDAARNNAREKLRNWVKGQATWKAGNITEDTAEQLEYIQNELIDANRSIDRILARIPDEAYKAIPWMIKQVKKNPQLLDDPLHTGDIVGGAGKLMHDLRNNNQRVPDINTLDFNGLQEWMYDYYRQLSIANGGWKERDTVYTFDDGWTVDQLTNADDAAREGDILNHCVGSYGQAIEDGTTGIFSLRDKSGAPYVTMEIIPRGDKVGSVTQVFGYGDTPPKAEYVPRIREFFDDLRSDGWSLEWAADEFLPERISDFSDLEDFVNEMDDLQRNAENENPNADFSISEVMRHIRQSGDHAAAYGFRDEKDVKPRPEVLWGDLLGDRLDPSDNLEYDELLNGLKMLRELGETPEIGVVSGLRYAAENTAQYELDEAREQRKYELRDHDFGVIQEDVNDLVAERIQEKFDHVDFSNRQAWNDEDVDERGERDESSAEWDYERTWDELLSDAVDEVIEARLENFEDEFSFEETQVGQRFYEISGALDEVERHQHPNDYVEDRALRLHTRLKEIDKSTASEEEKLKLTQEAVDNTLGMIGSYRSSHGLGWHGEASSPKEMVKKLKTALYKLQRDEYPVLGYQRDMLSDRNVRVLDKPKHVAEVDRYLNEVIGGTTYAEQTDWFDHLKVGDSVKFNRSYGMNPLRGTIKMIWSDRGYFEIEAPDPSSETGETKTYNHINRGQLVPPKQSVTGSLNVGRAYAKPIYSEPYVTPENAPVDWFLNQRRMLMFDRDGAPIEVGDYVSTSAVDEDLSGIVMSIDSTPWSAKSTSMRVLLDSGQIEDVPFKDVSKWVKGPFRQESLPLDNEGPLRPEVESFESATEGREPTPQEVKRQEELKTFEEEYRTGERTWRALLDISDPYKNLYYGAESKHHDVIPQQKINGGESELQRVTDEIISSDWFKETYPTVTNLDVRIGYDDNRDINNVFGAFTPGSGEIRITPNEDLHTLDTLLHELAHAVTSDGGGLVQPHGEEFAANHLYILRNVLGDEAADSLGASLRDSGAPISNRVGSWAPTETDRAHLAMALPKLLEVYNKRVDLNNQRILLTRQGKREEARALVAEINSLTNKFNDLKTDVLLRSRYVDATAEIPKEGEDVDYDALLEAVDFISENLGKLNVISFASKSPEGLQNFIDRLKDGTLWSNKLGKKNPELIESVEFLQRMKIERNIDAGIITARERRRYSKSEAPLPIDIVDGEIGGDSCDIGTDKAQSDWCDPSKREAKLQENLGKLGLPEDLRSESGETRLLRNAKEALSSDRYEVDEDSVRFVETPEGHQVVEFEVTPNLPESMVGYTPERDPYYGDTLVRTPVDGEHRVFTSAITELLANSGIEAYYKDSNGEMREVGNWGSRDIDHYELYDKDGNRLLWRGMSWEAMQSIKETGSISTNTTRALQGQEGFIFTHPQANAARYYADYQPGKSIAPDKPGYLVLIRDPGNGYSHGDGTLFGGVAGRYGYAEGSVFGKVGSDKSEVGFLDPIDKSSVIGAIELYPEMIRLRAKSIAYIPKQNGRFYSTPAYGPAFGYMNVDTSIDLDNIPPHLRDNEFLALHGMDTVSGAVYKPVLSNELFDGLVEQVNDPEVLKEVRSLLTREQWQIFVQLDPRTKALVISGLAQGLSFEDAIRETI